MKNTKTNFLQVLFALTFAVLLFTTNSLFAANISGELTPWHKVTISFNGPSTSETSIPNPFTDYRLDVVFTGPSGQIYNVPGFYATDGNAGETSADSGDIWQVNFCPDAIGNWTYKASFVLGENIAAELSGGSSAGFFDGDTGNFTVTTNTNTDETDFKNKGKLIYVNDHYLQFQETGEYFIKGGANSPEVLLQYAEFDNTNTTRLYPDHIADWKDGDPTWQGEKGKGIIGVMNYLSSIDVNSFYFLTMNAYGDGKEAWPWTHKDSIVRYDCSKLEQWDILFQHMNTKGIMVHFVLTETENEAYFEIRDNGEAGGFADSRKIYYREMIARYGYLPAVSWNIGEENGWEEGDLYHIGNTDQQRKDFSDRLRALSYYNDHVTVHNGPSTDDAIFEPLLGLESLTGPAFQWDYSKNIFNKMLEWRNKSAESGHKWVMNLDEPYINPATGNLDDWRTENVWASYMAGGAGIELYIGSGLDVSEQNLKQYEAYYLTMAYATNFLRKYVPFQEMIPDTAFLANDWTLRKNNEIYLLYLKNASETTIDLPENHYRIMWFNPRTGSAPTYGSVHYVDGTTNISIGTPLIEKEKDWVCLISKENSEKPNIDISKPVIDRIIEEGDSDVSKIDTIEISNAGSGVLDTLNLEIVDGSWLNVERGSFIDGIQTFKLSLNEQANNLDIGAYCCIITFLSDSAESISMNYLLTVEYNLHGQKYFYADNKIAVIEVESAELKPNWVMSTDYDGFSGDGYYYYDGELNVEPGDESNTYQYYFYLPKGGTYQIGVRIFNPDNNPLANNDVWISVDNAEWSSLFSSTNLEWSWETQLTDESNNTIDAKWELEEGFHVLKIEGKSTNFCIDKIHIYDTKIKEQVAIDSLLIPSGSSDRKQAIISASSGFYIYNYKEGRIRTLSSKTVKLSNVGAQILEPVFASATNDLVTPLIRGEGNAQILTFSFNEKVKELKSGKYTSSILLECENASAREIKIYFNIEATVGMHSTLNDIDIKLESNLIHSTLNFIGSYAGEVKVNIFNINGQLVFNSTQNNIIGSSINVDSLLHGFYTIRIQSIKGDYIQKFMKE